MVNCINLIIEMSPRFILWRENVPCVAEVVNKSLKADCTDYTTLFALRPFCGKSFMWFCLDILNQILLGILFGSASRINWDKLTVIEKVQDIESVSQRDCFMHVSYVLSLWAWNYHVINISDLFIQLVWKLERSLHESISWWFRLVQVFSDW